MIFKHTYLIKILNIIIRINALFNEKMAISMLANILYTFYKRIPCMVINRDHNIIIYDSYVPIIYPAISSFKFDGFNKYFNILYF
jgi:hypothetical protein